MTWTQFELTVRSRMTTERLVVAQLITKFPWHSGIRTFITTFTKVIILLYIESHKSYQNLQTLHMNICLNTIISFLCKSSNSSLTCRFTNLCFLRSYVISDTFYMTHHAIVLDLVPWMISGEGYKLWNSSLRILPQLLVTSCLLLAHIPPAPCSQFVLILVRNHFERPSQVALPFTFQSLHILKGGRMNVGT